jgi:hypothetical protein
MNTSTLNHDVCAAELERRIKAKGDEAMFLAVERDSLGARRCYVELAALIAQRTPETVARMERERGLR